MAGGLAGKSSSDRQHRRSHGVTEFMQDVQQRNSRFLNDRDSKDDDLWAGWLVPVFGVAAAASIALYTNYLKDLRRKAAAVKHIENKAFRTSKKLVDLSLTARNGTLVKSSSAFV